MGRCKHFRIAHPQREPVILMSSPSGERSFSVPWTFLEICAHAVPSSRPHRNHPLSSPHLCAQLHRSPGESSSPSSRLPSGWIIPASTALATSCRTGAVVSCFGTAPTWPCAPQGGRSWGSCPLRSQALPLPFFIPQVFIKYLLGTPIGTHCRVGENNGKQMTKLISGGIFLKKMIWVR